MNPNNQNYQPPVYTGNSLEYLEQISPKKPSPFRVVDKKIIIIASLFLAVIVIAIVAAVVNGSKGLPSGAVLGARYSALSELIKYGDGDKITDSNFKKALAEAEVVSLSSKYQLSKIVTLTASDPQITANESTTGLTATLDQAFAAGNLHQQYSALLISQINKIILSLQEVRTKVKDYNSINTIDHSIANLTEILSRLSGH